jgi:hypothetical protein
MEKRRVCWIFMKFGILVLVLGLMFGMTLGSHLPGIELSTIGNDPLNSKCLYHTTAHFENKNMDAHIINPTVIFSFIRFEHKSDDDYSSDINFYFVKTVNLIVNEFISAIGGFSPH